MKRLIARFLLAADTRKMTAPFHNRIRKVCPLMAATLILPAPGLRKILGQIARYGIVGAAIALLPLQQQALAQAILPTGFLEMSTVPSNGDLNPYGVAFVPDGFPGGALSPGDILVSNFNNSQNQQG